MLKNMILSLGWKQLSYFYITTFIFETCQPVVDWYATGCPTYFLPFSKAYILELEVSRSKIPTVLGVSWGDISYEKKKIFSKNFKKQL